MKQVQQTLLAQMKMSELEIQRRKDLFGIGSEEIALLTGAMEVMQQEVDSVVAEFYERQIADEEIALVIGDADTLRRLHVLQRQYVLDLFRGKVDADYVSNRLRIGMVHKRIGVEPKLYLSAVKSLSGIIRRALERNIEDLPLLKRTCQALENLLYFDVALIFDTYIASLISEIQIGQRRVEAYAESLEIKVAERTEQLRELSNRDPLTNLFNRRALMDSLRTELSHAHRRATPLSLIYFDVDRFKQLNDTYGHHFGDQVLKHIGEILLQHTRELDRPCRHGGDEFCVILPDCDHLAAEKVCRKIIELFSRKYTDITLSFGIVQTAPGDLSTDPETLVNLADRKMYEAKEAAGFQIRTLVCSADEEPETGT